MQRFASARWPTFLKVSSFLGSTALVGVGVAAAIVGAHLDSWDFGTGAQDNATGVAQVLDYQWDVVQRQDVALGMVEPASDETLVKLGPGTEVLGVSLVLVRPGKEATSP